jgi:hypothetical protein
VSCCKSAVSRNGESLRAPQLHSALGSRVHAAAPSPHVCVTIAALSAIFDLVRLCDIESQPWKFNASRELPSADFILLHEAARRGERGSCTRKEGVS